MAGPSCAPFFAANDAANTPRITARSEGKRKRRKGHSAFNSGGVGWLVGLAQNEVDFAGNPGTVPRQAASVWVANWIINVSWKRE